MTTQCSYCFEFPPALSSMLTNFLLITTSLSFGESFPTLCYPGGLTSSLLTGEHMMQNGLVTMVPVHGNWSKKEYFFFSLLADQFQSFHRFFPRETRQMFSLPLDDLGLLAAAPPCWLG